jgi:hypothetical protein
MGCMRRFIFSIEFLRTVFWGSPVSISFDMDCSSESNIEGKKYKECILLAWGERYILNDIEIKEEKDRPLRGFYIDACFTL